MKYVSALLKNGYFYATLAIVYLFFITFPAIYLPTGTGLDRSWQYAINYLPGSSFIYGKDVMFAYGPLGFLLLPQNIGNNVLISMIFQVLMHVLFTLALFYFLYRAKHKLQVILFIVFYLALGMLVSWWGGEYNLLMLLGLLLCIAFDKNKIFQYSSVAVCGVLAGLMLFIKFNLGMGALAMLIIFTASVIITQRKKAWRVLLAGAAIYITTVVIIAFIYLKSPVDIISWFWYSFDIAGGYSDAMSITGSYLSVLMGALMLLVYLTLIFIFWKQKAHPLLYIALIFSVPVFLAFKHGFCRQDIWHELSILVVPAILCVLLLNANNKKELLTCISGFIITFALTIAIIHPNANKLPIDQAPVNRLFTSTAELIGQDSGVPAIVSMWGDRLKKLSYDNADLLWNKKGYIGISYFFNYDNLLNWLDEKSNSWLAADRLPPEMLNILKSGGGTVDVLPWEISYIPANNLNWSPKFTLQSYNAYTSALDLRDSIHYTGEQAPTYLIVELNSLDFRNILLDTPASWYSILTNYELAYQDSTGSRLLLKKKTPGTGDKRLPLGSINGHSYQWVDVPPSGNLLFAKMDMRLNLAGRIARTFFRVPPVYLDLLFDSGRYISYRISPDTARNGLLINFVPSEYQDLAGIFNGVANDRVAKIRIRGSGTSYYDPEIGINWEESSYPIKLEPWTFGLKDMTYNGTTSSYNVDEINGQWDGMKDTYIINSVTEGEPITVTGWAFDQNARTPAGKLFITIDDKYDIPASYGLDRADVAEYFKEKNYRYSGYTAWISPLTLDRGTHTVSLKIVTADDKSYYMSDRKLNIVIN